MREKVSRLLIRAYLVGVTAMSMGGNAWAQTAVQRDGATVLLPFSTLNSTPEGRAVLRANLDTGVAINNASTAAQRAQAVSDNTQRTILGEQFVDALGPSLEAAFNRAKAAADPRFATTGSTNSVFLTFPTITGQRQSEFNKNFFGNGTTNGTTPAVGIPLPPGGVFNTYGIAYNFPPDAITPRGNARPYRVAPTRYDQFAPAVLAATTSSAFTSSDASYTNTNSLLLAIMVPERFQQELTRGSEGGLSRVILGVHYPLDVIGGRILAYQAVAKLLNNDPDYTGGVDIAAVFAAATTEYRAVLSQYCGGTIAVCAGVADTSRFADYAQNKADYTYRLTYGLPATGPTNLAPVVPVGAEVLLATRFPYLTAAQRRDVLASTEIASGAALDNGSGWARLNLFAAGGGYGTLTGTVNVTMDASRGGFNAYDVWLNDIGGNGSLIKSGTGTLGLFGANSFSGGVTVNGGTLLLLSNGALPSTGPVVNNAAISMQDGVAGGTATVASYSGGAGSRLLVDVNFATQTSDRLIVTGTIAPGSTTTIVVNDVSAALPAARLSAGIPIVVAKNSMGALGADNFTLAGGPFNKGLFQYQLAFSPDPQFLLVPVPSSDARRLPALTTGVQTLWFESASAWIDHQAELRDAGTGSTGKFQLWMRGFGRWIEREQSARSTIFTSIYAEDTSYRQRTDGILGGFDLGAQDVLGSGDKLFVGLSGGYVHSRQTFDGSATRMSQNGATLGLSATYASAGGLFVDVVAKADFTRLQLDLPALTAFGKSSARERVRTYGAVANFGYRMQLGPAWLEPVATISYADAGIPGFDIAGSRIDFEDKDIVRGRLGLRGGASLAATQSSRVALGGDASVWHRLSDRPTVEIDGTGTAPGVKLADDPIGTFGDVGTTLSYFGSRDGFTALARGGYQFGQDYHSYSVTAGLRVGF